jgi:hypothetical protein
VCCFSVPVFVVSFCECSSRSCLCCFSMRVAHPRKQKKVKVDCCQERGSVLYYCGRDVGTDGYADFCGDCDGTCGPDNGMRSFFCVRGQSLLFPPRRRPAWFDCFLSCFSKFSTRLSCIVRVRRVSVLCIVAVFYPRLYFFNSLLLNFGENRVLLSQRNRLPVRGVLCPRQPGERRRRGRGGRGGRRRGGGGRRVNSFLLDFLNKPQFQQTISVILDMSRFDFRRQL